MKNLTIKKRTAKDFEWTTWTPAQLRKSAKDALDFYKKEITKIKTLAPEKQTFETVIEKMEILDGGLCDAEGPVGYIRSTHPQKSMREAAIEVSDMMSKEGIEIGSDQEFLKTIDQALKNTDKKSLDTPALRLYESNTRGLKHSGFYLEKKDQTKLKGLRKKLVKIASDFESTINNWDEGIFVSKEIVDEFPKSYVDQLTFDKKKKQYRVTLDYPQMVPFMRLCPDEKLRAEMAELVGKKGGKKNLQRMADIVTLKTEIANLLGYETYADLKLIDKMAKNTKTVQKFIDKNIQKYHSKGQSELDVLRYAKEKSGSRKKLAGHDFAYFTDRVQEELYGLDSEKLKEYFTLDRVTEAMLEHFGKFFGVVYKEIKIKFPHESVRTFEVHDAKSGEIVGYFSMDMHPRTGKYGHACMQQVFSSYQKGSTLTTPYATLIMNVPLPTKDTPSLLEIREVETIFHEFGHVMHGVLGEAQYYSQSGTNVAWDFVEVPSQLFEEWVFEEKLLKKMGKHYQTGKTIPQEMIDQVIAARTFMESYFMLRQFTLSKIDMEIYTNPKKAQSIDKTYKTIFNKYLLPMSKDSLQPASFSHIASGYSAGYYSYAWSLELAKKFYTYIKKEGAFSPRVGRRLRSEVLEKGKTEDANVLVKNFLKK